MSKQEKLLPPLLPLLVVDGQVLLPGAPMTLRVEQPNNMQLLERHFWNEDNWTSNYIGVVPMEPEVYGVGTAATIKQLTWRSYPTPQYKVVLVGLCRFRIEDITKTSPFLVARVTQLDYQSAKVPLPDSVESQAKHFRSMADQFLHLLKLDDPTIKRILGLLPLHTLPDFLTSLVDTSFGEKLEILNAVELSKRFSLALTLLQRQITTLKASENSSQLKDPDEKSLGGFLLPRRRGKRGVAQEGGGVRSRSADEDELAELEERLNSSQLPEHALKVAKKELKRLHSLPAQFPEYAVSRNYLETLLDLPWSVATTDHIDLSQAKLDLERDHYALDKVKQRILEFLAVRKLKNSLKGPILCFVGAPGVGKTSVGRSVAHTLGRKFHRISLGGISDQADIRGHRRTYIGAMPGRIVQGLKAVGVNNPVFLLDEVDKLYHGLHGDPAAALLEVLDPEQNSTFVDHYLNIPFDLSQVLFVATANTSSKIPSALLDRMEVIEIPGYTVEEKVEIGRRHLLPKQLEQHGLSSQQLEIPPAALSLIVTDYTAEAGVRSFERMLGTMCRAAAVKVAGDNKPSLPIVTSLESLEEILGPAKYSHDVCERLTLPGVAVGLAWTAVGGEIMFIEASKMEGSGELVLTGQLGDVMKESAHIALNWVRATAHKYGWSCEGMNKTDLHLHFPAGAVGKDGPSAGVAIIVALVSLFSGRCVRSDTAFTGEVTLRGLVLPVGGVKDKVLAGHRAGITRVVLPSRNEKDLKEISDSVKRDIKFIFVDNLEDALANAFQGGIPILRSKL